MNPKIYSIFLLVLCGLGCTRTPEKNTVLLQPMEYSASVAPDSLAKQIYDTYGFNVIVAPPAALPQSAFVQIKSPRYRADSLLQHLKRNKPDSVDVVLGLTSKDISTTKHDKNGRVKKPESRYTDWGIFGLGYRPGAASVVSTYRLNNGNANTFQNRFKKVCIHELGHNLGLKHCTSGEACVMEDAAETIKTVDRVPMALCSSCKAKIN